MKHKPFKQQCNEIKEEVLEESCSLLKNTNDSLFHEHTKDKHSQPLRVSTTHHKNNKTFVRENSSSSHTSSSNTKPNTQTISKANKKNYREELDDINNKLNTIIDNELERHNHNHILYKKLTDNNKTNYNFLLKTKQQQESQKIDDTQRVFHYPITSNTTNNKMNYDNRFKVFSERKDIQLTESPLPKVKKFSKGKKFPIELISKRSQYELIHTANNTINTDDDERNQSHHTNYKRKLTIKRGKSSNTIQYNEDSNNELSNNGSRLLTNPCVSGRNFNFDFKRKRVHSAGYNKLKLYTNREDVSLPKRPRKILPSLRDNNKVCNDLNKLVTLATEKYSNDPEIKNMFNNLVNNINEMKLAIEKRNNSKDTSPLDDNKNPQSHQHYQSNLSSLKGKKLNKPFKKINLQKLFSQRKKENYKENKENKYKKEDI